ncbi:MAG: hypothetical protein AB1916_10505 [Thermodesulfobacteriota bacterium]
MATIMPQSELVRKALAWLIEERAETGKPLLRLIEEACMRFNLGPKDAECLQRHLADSGKPAENS